MAKINIVIADSDELYLNMLSNYLIEKNSQFDVCSFSAEESFVKYISDRNNKIDIVLFAENFLCDGIFTSDVKVKVILSDGTFIETKGFEIVNKYQKAEKLINDILMIYADKTGRVEAVSKGNKNTKIVGVYSPVGGSGKTTLALSLSNAISSMGMKVLYFNAEKINSTIGVLDVAPTGNLSDVFLAVKTKGANIGLKIIANKYTDPKTQINYINPPDSAMEFNELTIDDFKKLIKEVDALSEFDVVIVDMASEYTNTKIEIMSDFDVILTPFTADTLSINKIKQYLNEFKLHSDLSEIFAKTTLIANKTDANSMSQINCSGILEIKQLVANIPFSPAFSDAKNLAYAGNVNQGIFNPIINRILQG